MTDTDTDTFATTAQARTAAKRWRRMADELSGGDPPAEAIDKARELRSRASYAYDWANRNEGAAAPAAPRPRATRKLSAAPEPEPAAAPAGGGFDIGKLLSGSGFRVRDEGKSMAGDLGSAGSSLAKIGAGDFGGAGGFALTIVGGLLTLILLDLLISPRGSSISSAALRWSGSALQRLVSPTDPLTSIGHSTAPTPTAASTNGATGTAKSPVPGVLPVAVKPATGRAVPIPGSGYSVDAAYLGLTEWITKTFGVSVTSGWRSVVENRNAGGATNSDHLAGRAVDFGGSPAAMERLYRWAAAAGFPYVESPAQAVAAGEGPHVHISFSRPSTP